MSKDQEKYERIGEARLRELVNRMCSPTLDKLRADIRRAPTSWLFGAFRDPDPSDRGVDELVDQLVDLVPAEIGEDILNEAAALDLDEEELVLVAVAFALSDEIDRRVPVPPFEAP